MANFNTYQTRNLYVVKSFLESGEPDAAGELAIGTAATGEVFFKYFNGDGQLTRTDIIYPKNIVSLKNTAAADMDIKLKKHTIAIDTNKVTLANLVGKTLSCIITFHQVGSYDMNDTYRVVATVVGNATNTANAAAFHKALAEAIALVLPKRDFPIARVFSNGREVTPAIAKAGSAVGDATGVVLVETPQKYRRGLKSNEQYPFSVAFVMHDGNLDEIAWGTDTVADSDVSGYTVIPSVYGIADLEAFTMGERGDDKRGYAYPMNYEPTPLVDLSKSYDLVSVEYFWQGSAENVQKSPRMIQFACEVSGSGQSASSAAASIYSAIEAAMNGSSESEGEGE